MENKVVKKEKKMVMTIKPLEVEDSDNKGHWKSVVKKIAKKKLEENLETLNLAMIPCEKRMILFISFPMK